MADSIIKPDKQDVSAENINAEGLSGKNDSDRFNLVKEFLNSLGLLKIESANHYKEAIERYKKYLSDKDIEDKDRKYYEEKLLEAVHGLSEVEREQSANIRRGLEVAGVVAIAALAPKVMPTITRHIFKKR